MSRFLPALVSVPPYVALVVLLRLFADRADMSTSRRSEIVRPALHNASMKTGRT